MIHQVVIILTSMTAILSLTKGKDICGHYAVLTSVDEFYLAQPFTKIIDVGLDDYSNTFDQIDSQVQAFREIAFNYSNEKAIQNSEPTTLIPFTSDKNLIMTTEDLNYKLPSTCKAHKARTLEISPDQVPILTKILKEKNLDKVPIAGVGFLEYLINPSTFQVLDEPVDAAEKLTKIDTVALAYIDKEGKYLYPKEGNPKDETYRSKALCIKPNNFWDRGGSNRSLFIKTLIKIIKTIPEVLVWKNKFTVLKQQLARLGPPLTHSTSGTVGKYLLGVPPFLNKILSFFTKYNHVTAWERSTPTDFNDFLEYRKNFQEFEKTFKSKPNSLTSVSNNFLLNNRSMSLPYVDADRLLEFLGLDSTQFGITGPVEVTPLSLSPSAASELLITPTVTTTATPGALIFPTTASMTAKFQVNIFDKRDLSYIFNVKPLIYDGNVTTAKYVTKVLRHFIASTTEPTPYSCNPVPNDEIRACLGFQTPGVETIHQSSLVACGRALASEFMSSDHYSRCPTTNAPTEPLAYRANCGEEGIKTVILSSIRPLKVQVYCDTYAKEKFEFPKTPVTLETECEVRETVGEIEKILLPQLHADLEQQMNVQNIVTPVPGNITITTAAPPVLQNSLPAIISAVSVSIVMFSCVTMMTILAIFDKERCGRAFKTICCGLYRLTYCCKLCCKSENCCRCCPTLSEIERIEQQNKKAYEMTATQYNSQQRQAASAPLSSSRSDINNYVQESERFLPRNTPAPSRRGSAHSLQQQIIQQHPQQFEQVGGSLVQGNVAIPRYTFTNSYAPNKIVNN